MELVNIAKKNLVDEAHIQIKQMIQSGIWNEGELIPSENQLCRDLGVSRVVVREVLQRLRAQKLIVTKQGIGSFVSNPKNFQPVPMGNNDFCLTERAFLEVMEFRRIVECELLKLAIEHGTEEDFEQIRVCVDAMANSLDDVERFTTADLRFHMMIGKASHNELMMKVLETCQNELYACFYQMNSVSDVLEWGVEMHRNIYNAVVSKDPQKAVHALKRASEYNHARLSDFFSVAK